MTLRRCAADALGGARNRSRGTTIVYAASCARAITEAFAVAPGGGLHSAGVAALHALDTTTTPVPTQGISRRCQPQQPSSRKGELAEEVCLPAGPQAGAAATTVRLLLGANTSLFTNAMVTSVLTLGTPRRCQAR
jgi:hypothetical protein